MLTELKSMAEINAEKAESLGAFCGIKLLHIKNKIIELLAFIGRDGIFDQYTKHDITHIDSMLKIVEWLIPEETIKRMTHADWLMLVLSIYFHDLGMLVTKHEYLNRNNTEFMLYKEKIESGEFGLEYQEKVNELGEDSEKFIYQEYVRANHAARIKYWINNNTFSNIGECETVVQEINKMLENTDGLFRKDLAKICESHHLNDLDDFAKYKTASRYGTDDNEIVNVHFIAIILRTVDLLHITSDRTPSIQYRLINPSDPKSIIEWKKQMAVKAVCSKPSINKDGNVDITLPRDTIEVTAYFDKPDLAEAFFGLSAYLLFAKKEIKESYNLIQKAIKTQGTIDYNFPWKEIDDSNIETFGFERKLLQFNLDQNNILRLLIGHTLYNDSSVVFRELIQNSLDAIKFQNQLEADEKGKLTKGNVIVEWNDNQRKLSILDNGTGMSVNDIENYLLKVGTSKYRTEDFIKKYPAFSAISRFGIGILTCFLIANDIDIFTNSSEEDTANMISIRQFDGKYLLKKLDKTSLNSMIKEHGTQIDLHIRTDVNMNDLQFNIRKWILFPSSKVFLKINNSTQLEIGNTTPKEMLKQYLENYPIKMYNKIEIREDELDGITIAYAIKYSEYLNEWTFVPTDGYINLESIKFSPIGTCIEGIRIEQHTPGYNTDNILAIVNITGNGLAKTNVARSAIEKSDDIKDIQKRIYKIYSRHIQNQIINLEKDGYSLAWATSESEFLIKPLLPRLENENEFDESKQIEPQDTKLLYDALNDIKCMIIEKGATRKAASPNEVKLVDEVYIVDSKMIRAAESLLREIESDTTLCNLINTICHDTLNKFTDNDHIICNFNRKSILHTNALSGKQAVRIDVIKKQRRIDLLYKNDASIWLTFELITNNELVHIPITNLIINGIVNEIGVKTIDGIYLSYNHELTKYIIQKIKLFDYENNRLEKQLASMFLSYILHPDSLKAESQRIEEYDTIFDNLEKRRYRSRFNKEAEERIWARIEKNEFLHQLYKEKYYIYNPSEWSRGEQY